MYQKENKTFKNKHVLIIVSIIFLTILTPDVRIENLPSIRLEQIFSLSVLTVLFIREREQMIRKITTNSFVRLFALFPVFIFLSILVGYVKSFNIIVNDFFEIYKVIVFLSIYIVAHINIKNDNDRDFVLKCTQIFIVISVLISVQQYYNLFGLNEKYVQLIAPTQYITLVNGYPYPRVIGLTSNPNIYALFPAIGSFISLLLFFKSKKKINIFYLGIFVLGELMTLSRSGFIFMIFGLLYIYISYNFDLLKEHGSKERFKNILKFILIFVISFMIINLFFKDLTWRLLEGLNIFKSRSFQARFIRWKEHLNIVASSPIFGIGPGKGIKFVYRYSDNEFILLLRRYGIVGLFYLIASFTIPFRYYLNSIYKELGKAILIGSFFYMIPSAIYHSFQAMSLIVVFFGIIPINNVKVHKQSY